MMAKKLKPKAFAPLPFPDRDPSIWHEELVGVVPRYPRTATAFAKRHGLPVPVPGTTMADMVKTLSDTGAPFRDRMRAAQGVEKATRGRR